MANVIINDVNLTNIANAIRTKNGSTDTYKPSEMAAAINELSSSDIPEFTITGNMEKLDYYGRLDEIISYFGDKISTKDLSSIDNMFADAKLEKIPFSINLKTTRVKNNTSQAFNSCKNLKELPDMSGTLFNCYAFMSNCHRVRTIPDSWVTDVDWSRINAATAWSDCRLQNFCTYCYSLRSIPEAFLKQFYNSSSGSNANGGVFSNCYALDEIVGFRGPNATLTSSAIYNFSSTCRLKRLVFDMEDGAPRVENWQNQTIDLSYRVGYAAVAEHILGYNSGITADKEVVDDATYQALKNDADWSTIREAYSRYNHDSAVETINSLPDTSASGGTNTIKFLGAAGSATDGGAINTLTEEEIAVATAKGWTVSLV